MLSCPPKSTLSLLHGDITTLGERNWSPLSYFFIMVTLQPWITLGFHLSNPMNMNGCRSPLHRFPDSAHTGGQRVGMFSLSLLFWQFKKEDREFQLLRNLVQMMEHPTGQSDFESNIDGVVSIKEY